MHDGGALEVAGSRVPGAILLVVFACVGRSSRSGCATALLLLLDAVLGVALVLGLVSSARIFGTVWFYLLLWAWGLVALMLFAIGWTAVELVRARCVRRRSAARREPIARVGAAALVAVAVVASVVFAVQAHERHRADARG